VKILITRFEGKCKYFSSIKLDSYWKLTLSRLLDMRWLKLTPNCLSFTAYFISNVRSLVEQLLQADIMTRHKVICVKALFSSDFPLERLYQVPVVRLSNYIKLITQLIFPSSLAIRSSKSIPSKIISTSSPFAFQWYLLALIYCWLTFGKSCVAPLFFQELVL